MFQISDSIKFWSKNLSHYCLDQDYDEQNGFSTNGECEKIEMMTRIISILED